MTSTRNEILEAIESIHTKSDNAEYAVLESMINTYGKAVMILENCDNNVDLTDFAIFREGYYMEDGENDTNASENNGDTANNNGITKTSDGGYKINGSDQTYYKDKGFRRMKEDGSGVENIIWSIVSALPRLLKKLWENITKTSGNEQQEHQKSEQAEENAKHVQKQMQSDSQPEDAPSWFENAIDFGKKFIDKTVEFGNEHKDALKTNAAIGGGVVLSGAVASLLIRGHNKKKFINNCNQYVSNIISIIASNNLLKQYVIVPQTGSAIDIEMQYIPKRKLVRTNLNINEISPFITSLYQIFEPLKDVFESDAVKMDINSDEVDAKSLSPFEIQYKKHETKIKKIRLFTDTNFTNTGDVFLNLDMILGNSKKLGEIMNKLSDDVDHWGKVLKELKNKEGKDQYNQSRIKKIEKLLGGSFVKDLEAHSKFINAINELARAYKDAILEEINTITNQLSIAEDDPCESLPPEQYANELIAAFGITGSEGQSIEEIKQDLINIINSARETKKLRKDGIYGQEKVPENTSEETPNPGNKPNILDEIRNENPDKGEAEASDKPRHVDPYNMPGDYMGESYDSASGWSFSFNG